MEDEAGGTEGVVGDAGALVDGQVGVGFAGHDNGDAPGGESGAQAAGERQCDVFLEKIGGDACAGVYASVRGVDDH